MHFYYPHMTLRELREMKGLSQVEVAERGDLQQTTVSQIELGKLRDPRHSTFEKLSKAYGVRVNVVVAAFRETMEAA